MSTAFEKKHRLDLELRTGRLIEVLMQTIEKQQRQILALRSNQAGLIELREKQLKCSSASDKAMAS